jgi:hypothetical protein
MRGTFERDTAMRSSIRTLAWLRDLVIVLLLIAGVDELRSATILGILLIASGVVIFAERFLWSWYLLGLRDDRDEPQGAA